MVPTTEIIRDIRPQIPNTSTFTGNITYISQNIINLSVNANIPHTCGLLKVQQDEQLEEFLRCNPRPEFHQSRSNFSTTISNPCVTTKRR